MLSYVLMALFRSKHVTRKQNNLKTFGAKFVRAIIFLHRFFVRRSSYSFIIFILFHRFKKKSCWVKSTTNKFGIPKFILYNTPQLF